MQVTREAEDKGCVLFGRCPGYEIEAFGSHGVRASVRIEHGIQTYTVKYYQGGKMTVHIGDRMKPTLTLKADMVWLNRPWYYHEPQTTLKMTGVKGENTYELNVKDGGAIMIKRGRSGMEGKR